MVLFWQECRMNFRTMLVWAFCVGGLCLGCLLLFDSLGDSVGEMSEMFSDMGAFSEALGMDRVSIGTLEGYYAVEISMLLSLGGALYGAMLGAGLIAKEEEGKTYEFLNVHSLGRSKILCEKYGALVVMLAVFHGICICLILAGFAWMGDMPDGVSFVRYHGAAFLMCLEIGTLCFLLSALCRKRPVGASVGVAVLLYMMELMCRVVPALKKIKYVTPFYYCNAADIFAGADESAWLCGMGIGAAILCAAFLAALVVYEKKELM